MGGRPPKELSVATEKVENVLAGLQDCENALWRMVQNLTQFGRWQATGQLREGDVDQLIVDFSCIARRLTRLTEDLRTANTMHEILRTKQEELWPNDGGQK